MAGCNDVPPGCIHTSQCSVPACVQSGEPPYLLNSAPTSGNGGARSEEHASTSGDHQEAPRVCQTLCHPVCLPLQPLAKLPLYTADRKRCTKSPEAVKPAGVPSHVPGPCARPLSLLPRGEGAACPIVRGTPVFHMSKSFCDDPRGCKGDWKFLHPA